MSSTRIFSFVLAFIFFTIIFGLSREMPGRSQDAENNSYGWFMKNDLEWYLMGCDFPRLKGYVCEEHEVETKDGYILTLHRIPRGKNNCTNYNKVVIIQHGFLGSATNFLINSPKQSLGYLFADSCYDVWMPNSRGNTYSLKHNTYTSDDEEFWKFSFDEMAEFDLPACIDYILRKTSQKSLYYIGHSQGATIAFIAFSENKELSKKVRFLGTLSPVGYATHMTSSATSYSEMSDQTLYLILGRKSIFGSSSKRNTLITMACKSMTACVKLGEMIGGTFSPHMNKSRLTVYYTHTPAGSSVQNFVHWAQLMRNKESRKYNFDSKLDNIAKYGMTKPPKIKFNKVDVPVAMFTGASDTIANPTDAKRLANELPNLVTKVEISDYSHLDFIFAMNTEETIFKPLSFLMKIY